MLLDRFWKRGKAFLGCKYSILCGAITWVRDPDLVASVADAGGFGLSAGGSAPVDILDSQIRETRDKSDHPFGVNLITLASIYQEQLKFINSLQCSIIVFAGRLNDIRRRNGAATAVRTTEFRKPNIGLRPITQ